MINTNLTRVSQASSSTPLRGQPDLSCQSLPHRTPSLSYASELSLVAFKDQVSLNYFLSNYPWAHWWKSIVIAGLQDDTTSASYLACESLLTGYLGIGHSDMTLQHRSMRLYGGSMRLVSLGLDVHANIPLADLILPVMILGMYPVSKKKVSFVRWQWLLTPVMIVRYGEIRQVRA